MSSKIRPPGLDERIAKAEKLIQESKSKYKGLRELEEELGTIKRKSKGCENVFHSLVRSFRSYSLQTFGGMEGGYRGWLGVSK
ncbi:hypothetical protein AKJ57_04180 [candidate division MSBL1 archaeon SCGC-AAA259A05]|uniref:Uncharacterized protein n=1 Tax=candidate division MSBL1 archaeon SCGC-AAA259A05 TaxID=1698259 RepID=A0A133U865_9EURY|nr:hypothetical protein AKJ57_04180 [candidate division MSBL1 archaeon SCGC-AAA259A05]